MKSKDIFLLERYFNSGKLNQRYYDGKAYCQPYSAEDRLLAGQMFYEDFLSWNKTTRVVCNYEMVKVDVSFCGENGLGRNSERFRRALRILPKISLEVVYKIVLSEEDIKAPSSFTEREKAYFNDEIRGLLCRGLDELCRFYAPHTFSKII